MEHDTLVVVLLERLKESGVHERTLVEAQMLQWLHHKHVVVDTLSDEERMQVPDEQLQVLQAIAVRDDDGDLVRMDVVRRYVLATVDQLEVLELRLYLAHRDSLVI